MLKKQFGIALAAMVLLSACGNNGEDSNNSADTAQVNGSGDTKTKTGFEDKRRADIKLVVSGGDNAGTYNTVCRDACCSFAIAGEKTFGNQYSETGKGANELSSVQLVVENVTSGSTKTTNEFLVTVSFGELFGENSKTYTINTQKGKGEGSGTVTVQYANDKAHVTLKGKTKEGVELDLDMECHKVINPNNLTEELE